MIGKQYFDEPLGEGCKNLQRALLSSWMVTILLTMVVNSTAVVCSLVFVGLEPQLDC